MSSGRNKIKFAIILAVIFPCLARLNFHNTGQEFDNYRYILPLFVGGFAGFLIGLMKDRWLKLQRNLEYLVEDRTKVLKHEIEKRKQAEKVLRKHRHHLEEIVEQRTKELRDAQEEVIKREKLSVLGRLTAIVSHDLRNPLGVIRSSTYYLESKLRDADDKIAKHLQRIDKQVGLCDSIVDELLEYTRGRRSAILKRELNPLIEEIMNEMATPDQVTIVRKLSPELPMVSFDQEKMRRVVINLVNNAVQAVIERQEKLKEEEGPYQPQVKLVTALVENGVSIEVEDNGAGMDEETVSHAFEPLFTTRARGSGLGLAIVKKIVEEHGGRVELSSEQDRGTKAIVVIPLKSEKNKMPG